MTEEEAATFGIELEQRRLYVRLDKAKVNIEPPAAKATWFRLIGVRLGNATEMYPNGDEVQTVEPWSPPETWAGLWAGSINSISSPPPSIPLSRASDDDINLPIVIRLCTPVSALRGWPAGRRGELSYRTVRARDSFCGTIAQYPNAGRGAVRSKIRLVGKRPVIVYEFRVQVRRHEWVDGVPKVPFRLPELIAAPRGTAVAVCAGEKDVLTMVKLGYLATCNPGGEIPKAWTPELNCWFVGRPVVIVEDNDATGRAHTCEVAQALTGVAASIKVLRFPDVPEHEDVTWWVEEGHHGKSELDARIAAATEAADDDSDVWDAGDDPGPIPPRGWLSATQFCRQFLSLLVAPGGTGKTALRYLQAIELAREIPKDGRGARLHA
jgi:hypothetical protein